MASGKVLKDLAYFFAPGTKERSPLCPLSHRPPSPPPPSPSAPTSVTPADPVTLRSVSSSSCFMLRFLSCRRSPPDATGHVPTSKRPSMTPACRRCVKLVVVSMFALYAAHQPKLLSPVLPFFGAWPPALYFIRSCLYVPGYTRTPLARARAPVFVLAKAKYPPRSARALGLSEPGGRNSRAEWRLSRRTPGPRSMPRSPPRLAFYFYFYLSPAIRLGSGLGKGGEEGPMQGAVGGNDPGDILAELCAA